MKYIFFSTHITTRQSLAVYPMSVWCLEVELLWGPSGRFGDLALPSSATPPVTWFGQWARDVEAESSSGLVYIVFTLICTFHPFLKIHPDSVHWNFFWTKSWRWRWCWWQVKRVIEQWTPNRQFWPLAESTPAKYFSFSSNYRQAAPSSLLVVRISLLFFVVWIARYCRTVEQSMESLWGHLEW